MSEELEKLKKENEELKERLKSFESTKEELFAHKIFIESRKKFLQWTSVVLVLVTAFGFISAKALIDTIRDEIKEQGTEKIIEEIKIDFIKAHRDEIRQGIVKELIPYISGQIDEALREEMIKRFKGIEKVQLTNRNIDNFSNAVIESFEEDRYMVIGGSSPRRIDLEYLIEDVKGKIGISSYKDLFPNTKIQKSRKHNSLFLVIIQDSLTFTEAQRVRDIAVENGFRDDTFLRKSNSE